MSTYVIGDVQGCFDELKQLLTQIEFNPDHDTLWFTGDLINRGPNSLAVLRFVKALGDRHQIVLGNHDLHLLAVAYGAADMNRHDTINDILTAPDKAELIDWLRHCPLLYHDAQTAYVLVHAGLAPAWTIKQAEQLAREVETVLRSSHPSTFLKHMYGNLPDEWRDDLSGVERLRCITNYLTRMRFCYTDGRLDLIYKGEIAGKPKDLIPWFEVKPRANAEAKIIFGHWAALGGEVNMPNLYALDTGCVWGNCLTAMRLEDEKRFRVNCAHLLSRK